MIRLYHFTSEAYIDYVRNLGLMLGMLVREVNGKLYAEQGYQWLTSNPEWNQSWCEAGTLPYRRNDYRITVDIPNSQKSCLHKWTDYCQRNPNPFFNDLNSDGDPENWYIFHGYVQFGWFKKIDKNPDIIVVACPRTQII